MSGAHSRGGSESGKNRGRESGKNRYGVCLVVGIPGRGGFRGIPSGGNQFRRKESGHRLYRKGLDYRKNVDPAIQSGTCDRRQSDRQSKTRGVQRSRRFPVQGSGEQEYDDPRRGLRETDDEPQGLRG